MDTLDQVYTRSRYLVPEQVRTMLLYGGRLQWPKGIFVSDVQVGEGPDQNGDESLFVLLLVPDKTPEKVLASKAAWDAHGVVREVVRGAGDPRFAYVRMLREREPAELERIRQEEDVAL